MSGGEEATWLRSALNDANIEITNLKAEVSRLKELTSRVELYDQLGSVLIGYSEGPSESLAVKMHETIIALMKARG